jgi:hypothetical protein
MSATVVHMFESTSVAAVRERLAEMRDLVGRLEPDAVPLPEAPAVWQAFDAIERLAASAKTLLAARVDESRVWQRAGDRSAPEYLARKSGSSLGAARSSLETSKRVRMLPHTRSAMRRGELSRTQAEHIADAAAAKPDAEQSLLHAAAGSSLGELRERCARTKAAADPNQDATNRRLHRERRLRRWTDSEGAWNLSARGTADAGSRFNSVLNPIIDELFNDARREGRCESREAYAFDALIELARRHIGRPGATASLVSKPVATGDTPPARDASAAPGESATASASGMPANESPTAVPAPSASAAVTHLALLRVDLEALVRGRVEGDELCEITGLGPVPVATARALLSESILKLVITNGIDVANVTHLGRGPTVAQRIALLWSSPGCDVRGCSSTISLQADHRVPWANDQVTELANLDHLCSHHHRLKTHHGWALIPGVGKRPIVPPGDPHHPENQSAHWAATRVGRKRPVAPSTATFATESEDTKPRDPPHRASARGDAA